MLLGRSLHLAIECTGLDVRNSRTGCFANRAVHCSGGTELTAVDQKKAAGAHEFIRLLRRYTFGNIGGRSRLRHNFFVFIFVVISCGCDSVLEDRVEVSFDVVGIEILFLVIVVFTLWSSSECCVGCRFVLVLVVVNECDVVGKYLFKVLNEFALEVFSLDIDVYFFFVEFLVDGIVSHGVLRSGPPRAAGVIRAADDRHSRGSNWCLSCQSP